jgi:hypothetical protein
MLDKDIESYFKIKYTFRGKRYGISTSAIKSRLKCYVTHIPFTRKLYPRYHDLDCGSLIICGLDNWISNPTEIIQAMLDDPAFEVKIKKNKREELNKGEQ